MRVCVGSIVSVFKSDMCPQLIHSRIYIIVEQHIKTIYLCYNIPCGYVNLLNIGTENDLNTCVFPILYIYCDLIAWN